MNQTPEEALTGRKPYVGNLKVFGSLCYKHVPTEKRKKLDDRSEAMILVGFHHTGTYKLFDPKTKRIAISRDVVFYENGIYNWELLEEKNVKNQVLLPVESSTESETEQNPQEAERRTGRPKRNKKQSTRLEEYHVFPDSAITDEGELLEE